jgi:hypothetical protein
VGETGSRKKKGSHSMDMAATRDEPMITRHLHPRGEIEWPAEGEVGGLVGGK